MEKLPECFPSERIVKFLSRVPSMKQKVDCGYFIALISAQFCREIVELNVISPFRVFLSLKRMERITGNARSDTKLRKHFIQLLCDFFGVRFLETAHLPLP